MRAQVGVCGAWRHAGATPRLGRAGSSLLAFTASLLACMMSAAAIGLAQPAAAQVTAQPVSAIEVGLFGGGYVDYPAELFNDGCQHGVAGLGGESRFWPVRWLGLEAGAVINFHAGSTACAERTSLPIPIDSPYTRTVYDEQLGDSPSLDTSIGAALEPFRGSLATPGARVGFGRDWQKGFDFWYLGGGVRFLLGRHGLLLDIERRKFDLERERRTLIARSSGSIEVLDTEVETIERVPWFVRVGWSWALGGD